MLAYRESPRRDLPALLAAAMMLAGCLANPEAEPPAPPPPIDGGSAPDAPLDSGPCGGCVDPSPFWQIEGGELRLERFQDSADDSVQTLAAQAYFFKDQRPLGRPFGGLPLTLRPDLVNKGYFCDDLRDGFYFDNGKTEEAQDIADTRTYYDVGATATLTSAEEPFEVVRLDKFLESEDPDGATDLASGLRHDVLYKGDPAQRIRRSMAYSPSIAGSADYPLLDLKWGESADGTRVSDEITGVGTPQIYMPSAFVLTSPTDEEFFTPGLLTFTRGQDLVITYTADATPADWPTLLPYARFVDDEGRVQATCMRFRGDAGGDGSVPHEFVVPYEVLEIARPNGRLVFGRMVHLAWENQLDRSRVDLIGMESKRSTYTIQGAAD